MSASNSRGIVTMRRKPRLCRIWCSHSGSYESTVSWDITSCSALKINRRFGEISSPLSSGSKISQARNQPESRWQADCHFMLYSCAQIPIRLHKWVSCAHFVTDAILLPCSHSYIIESDSRQSKGRHSTVQFMLSIRNYLVESMMTG
jgi:hypothetical protein